MVTREEVIEELTKIPDEHLEEVYRGLSRLLRQTEPAKKLAKA